MAKKAVVALLAVVSVIVVSQTVASAATCLTWRTIGGSSMCVAWATKGVQVAVTFKDCCFVPGEGGDFQDCTATASASGSDSIVFCGSPTNPVRVSCNQPFSFGPTTVGAGFTSCTEHPDNESGAGDANEHHRCVSSATLSSAGAQSACAACCAAAGAGACLDLTPIEMHTELDAFYGGSEGGTSCADGSSSCTIEQTCSINPKKIALITDPSLGKEYQCNTDCVGSACFTD